MIPVSRPSLGPAELSAVGAVFDTGWLGMGATTRDFETAVGKRIGCDNIVAVNTGTSALHMALDGFGIGRGDEVILPSLTYVACAQAVIATGARPVFCESDPETLLIRIDDVERRITPRTRAVMPVHYCGQACDMDALLDLAARHGLVIVEDAAHAFGSAYRGRPIGSFGHATCFSFDPIKVVTCGEGGAVTVQDPEMLERLRRKRILGIDKETWKRYRHERALDYAVTMSGFRYHMPNFCAAIGLVQLEKMDIFIARRRDVCRRYDDAFSRLIHVRPLRVDYTQTAPFMYILRVPDGRRPAFIDHLRSLGVDTGIHYIPNHLHPYFHQFATDPPLEAERIGSEIVTIPLFSDITDEEAERVMEAVETFRP